MHETNSVEIIKKIIKLNKEKKKNEILHQSVEIIFFLTFFQIFKEEMLIELFLNFKDVDSCFPETN